MTKRILTIVAITALLALSAGPAFAEGYSKDITAHVKGQDLPLYSITITSGSTLTYNVVDGVTVADVEKGKTAGADGDLVVSNSGTEDVVLWLATQHDRPSIYQDSIKSEVGFDLAAGPGAWETANEGLWEFAPLADGVPGQFLSLGGDNANSYDVSTGPLASGGSRAFASRLTLPTALPVDAPSLYMWRGTVMASAVNE